jgi:hypothetical protein
LYNTNNIFSTYYLSYVSVCKSLFPIFVFHNNTKLQQFFEFTKLKIVFYNNLLNPLSLFRTLKFCVH